MDPLSNAIRLRGGGPDPTTTPAVTTTRSATAASDADPAAKSKHQRVRLTAFDSMRFFLIMTIVLGHFIKFANPSDFIFRLLSQHNASVGAFFALSGYVTAYTSTENAQRAASPKFLDTPKQEWTVNKIFGYLPLHLFVLAIFSPMFLFVDLTYNGWTTALWNAFLSITLLQAWFPGSAEIWNAPTWFLSALNAITAIIPFGLPSIAKMSKPQLRKTGFWLFLAYFLPKLGLAYDLKTWRLFEGVANSHPNLYAFNLHRFFPLFNVAEVFLGVIACRLVMLDGAAGEKEDAPKTNALSTTLPFVGILGLTYARAAMPGLDVSDMLIRTLIYVPLFLKFLMAAHRNTVRGKSVTDPLLRILSLPLLVALGNLSFPIYIVHGPIGQIFFKKLVAKKLFGQVLMGPTNFGIYLSVTLAAAYALQRGFLQNKVVTEWSKSTCSKLAKWM